MNLKINKMKIVKRGSGSPLSTVSLFIIPAATYIYLKLTGNIIHDEWLWCISIPIMFTIWAAVNFKITK